MIAQFSETDVQYQNLGTHKIIAAGFFTTAGGDTTEQIDISGVLDTDVAFVVAKSGNANVSKVVPGADKLTVTLDANPGADDVLMYMVVRAIV